MEAKSVLSGLILGWFFALWLGARLVDVNVPIITVPSDRLRNSIDTSGQYCPYSLTVEQYWRKGPKEHISSEGFLTNLASSNCCHLYKCVCSSRRREGYDISVQRESGNSDQVLQVGLFLVICYCFGN